MTDAGFFRGTSADQDNRFANKQKKLLKELNFSPILNTKLNMTKIDIDSLKPWIEEKIKNVLEKEDDLLSDSIFEHLAEKEPDGKNILVIITGFVDEVKASKFMEELWTKLIDLQESSNGTSKTCEIPERDAKLGDESEEARIMSEKPNDTVTNDKDEENSRDRRSSSRSSRSAIQPSRSVSRSPGGNHKLDEQSRGRTRRRPQDDISNGSRTPTPEKRSKSPSKDGSRSRSGSRNRESQAADRTSRDKSRCGSSSRSRSRSKGSDSRSRSRSGSRSRSSLSKSRSISRSRTRSRSRSPRYRGHSPYGGYSYRGRRSRSPSRCYRPRSRSPRGRRGFSRGPYRGSFGYERRRGFTGAPIRRRQSPWRRRFSPRSPIRRRRSPSYSPRRRRSPLSPYGRRRPSRSRSPPAYQVGRGLHSPRPYHAHQGHMDPMAHRHMPHAEAVRPIVPRPRSPRGPVEYRGYADGPLMSRHHSPPIAHGKTLDIQPSISTTIQPIPSGSGLHSPPSSSRKKHKKEKKHKKHKKSSKKHSRDRDSESPDRKRKKHKKHKKTKKHK